MAPNRLACSLQDHVQSLHPSWRQALAAILASQGWANLVQFVDARLAAGATIYPAQPLRALNLTPPESVRVVVLGQDPYHGPGQAQGLAFSVPTGFKRPPSLRNIFQEIARTCGGNPDSFDNDLTRWAQHGVLLLNTLLTVEDGQAASHARQGWEAFTDSVIEVVAHDPRPKVFLLWGAHAQSKRNLIPASAGHQILMANHPSPLSATRGPVPFVGSDHFCQANAWLAARHLPPIPWA